MYDSAWWRKVVATWEVVVYNPLLDLETWGLPLVVLVAAGALAARCRHRWQHLLPWPWPLSWRGRRKPAEGGRDLSV